MGIRHLNRLLLKTCNNLSPKNISFMQNWKVAVDINNYLYKIIEGDLIKNIETFCNLMKLYNIKPIFIFDGKPPKEKVKLIQDRKFKMLALKNKLELLEKLQNKTQAIEKTINILKRKTKKITYLDILNVKEYLNKNNEIMLVSENNKEADDVCKEMIENGLVDAIISDDMDFVGGGCQNVIRMFDQKNRTASLYNFSYILNDMSMTKDEFKEMCEKLKKFA
jgi:5'-3' exonuclease